MIRAIIYGIATMVLSVLFYANLIIGYGQMPSYWGWGLVVMFSILCGYTGRGPRRKMGA